LYPSLGYITPFEMELKLKGITKKGAKKIALNLLGSP
jgi:hypothetical protein